MIDRAEALQKWEDFTWSFPINALQERLVDKADDYNFCAYNGYIIDNVMCYLHLFDDFVAFADTLCTDDPEANDPQDIRA